jgi:chromosome segregation ATPase
MKKNSEEHKTDKSDFEQKTRVLLEEIHQQVKTVAEGHGDIILKLNEHDKKFNKIESELGTVKMAVMTIIGDVKTLRSDVDTLKGDVKMLRSDVGTLKGDVKTIKGDVKTLNNKLDENITNNEKRISKLEEKVFA